MTSVTAKRYLSCAETAKLLRAALKSAHPGVKFSVKSHTYSGGASIRVGWTDGPTAPAVDSLVTLYTGGSFDGMTDSMSYHDTLLAGPDGMPERVHFGADFIFTERTVSDALVTSLLPLVAENGHDSYPSQCGNCGNWTPAGARWTAPTNGTGRDFCCSQQCAGQLLARYTATTASQR